MRDLDEFAAEARKAELHLAVDAEGLNRVMATSGDSLFYVPILAFCILVVARGKKGTLATADIAIWTAATLTRFFAGLAGARKKLEWSVPHRRRCADALVFLESVRLLRVEERPQRQIECTPEGMEFVRTTIARPDEVGLFCRSLDRSYRALEHHGIGLL